jgi:hypothetical protein
MTRKTVNKANLHDVKSLSLTSLKGSDLAKREHAKVMVCVCESDTLGQALATMATARSS